MELLVDLLGACGSYRAINIVWLRTSRRIVLMSSVIDVINEKKICKIKCRLHLSYHRNLRVKLLQMNK